MKWGRAPEKGVGKKFSLLLETGKGGAETDYGYSVQSKSAIK